MMDAHWVVVVFRRATPKSSRARKLSFRDSGKRAEAGDLCGPVEKKKIRRHGKWSNFELVRLWHSSSV
jgi:hypothetical protein